MGRERRLLCDPPDIDECESNGTMLCESETTGRVCTNTPGSHQCHCQDGFEFSQNNTMCMGKCSPKSTRCSISDVLYVQIWMSVPLTVVNCANRGVTTQWEATTALVMSGTSKPVHTTAQVSRPFRVIHKVDVPYLLAFLSLTARDVCTELDIKCSPHSSCVNYPDSVEGFRCVCDSGYRQNGKSCTLKGMRWRTW